MENPQLGDVTLSKRGIKADIGHGIGPEKVASYAAVSDILTQGLVVDYRINWKNRGYDTAIVAAPIKIGTVEYMVGVVLKRTSMTNSFYVHEVAAIEKGALPFNQDHRAITQDGEPSGDTPSINNILQIILDVKKGNSTASGGADGILYQDRDVDSDGKQLSAG